MADQEQLDRLHKQSVRAWNQWRVKNPDAQIDLIGADLVARTVQAPAEVPIGVVTACIGAPFFLVVLVSRRAARGVGLGES